MRENAEAFNDKIKHHTEAWKASIENLPREQRYTFYATVGISASLLLYRLYSSKTERRKSSSGSKKNALGSPMGDAERPLELGKALLLVVNATQKDRYMAHLEKGLGGKEVARARGLKLIHTTRDDAAIELGLLPQDPLFATPDLIRDFLAPFTSARSALRAVLPIQDHSSSLAGIVETTAVRVAISEGVTCRLSVWPRNKLTAIGTALKDAGLNMDPKSFSHIISVFRHVSTDSYSVAINPREAIIYGAVVLLSAPNLTATLTLTPTLIEGYL